MMLWDRKIGWFFCILATILYGWAFMQSWRTLSVVWVLAIVGGCILFSLITGEYSRRKTLTFK